MTYFTLSLPAACETYHPPQSPIADTFFCKKKFDSHGNKSRGYNPLASTGWLLATGVPAIYCDPTTDILLRVLQATDHATMRSRSGSLQSSLFTTYKLFKFPNCAERKSICLSPVQPFLPFPCFLLACSSNRATARISLRVPNQNDGNGHRIFFTQAADSTNVGEIVNTFV